MVFTSDCPASTFYVVLRSSPWLNKRSVNWVIAWDPSDKQSGSLSLVRCTVCKHFLLILNVISSHWLLLLQKDSRLMPSHLFIQPLLLCSCHPLECSLYTRLALKLFRFCLVVPSHSFYSLGHGASFNLSAEHPTVPSNRPTVVVRINPQLSRWL